MIVTPSLRLINYAYALISYAYAYGQLCKLKG